MREIPTYILHLMYNLYMGLSVAGIRNGYTILTYVLISPHIGARKVEEALASVDSRTGLMMDDARWMLGVRKPPHVLPPARTCRTWREQVALP